GAYGQVLFLTLLEAGFEVVLTPPQFARQITGRPKTDRRDCPWIQRLHQLGLLPSVFQPDAAPPDPARLRPPARHPGAPERPAHPADAEGPGADDPQADVGARRGDRRHRPADHPRPPGRGPRPAAPGPVARPAVPACRAGDRPGAGRPLPPRAPPGA